MIRTLRISLVVLLAVPALALADELPPAPPQPSIVHAPDGRAPTGEPLVLAMDLVHPELIDRVMVHWRAGASGAFRATRVRRGVEAAWAAQIRVPRRGVDRIEYYVTMTTRDGASRVAFASPEDPHVVVILPTPDDAQETAELAFRSGRRLDLAAGAEWIDLGRRRDEDGSLCDKPGQRCRDDWYTLYGAVRYHFLRRVRSVGVRIDRLRGVTARDGNETRVGLVGATVDVELRLAPAISLSFVGILGANEEAVQPGGGFELSFGVGEPTRLDVGLRGVANVGWTFDAWMRWLTIPRTPLGAGIEVTNEPGAGDDAAVRLLAEVGRQFGQNVTVTLRGGYGARDLRAGGPSLGGQAQVSF
jgi:hypothetical protein